MSTLLTAGKHVFAAESLCKKSLAPEAGVWLCGGEHRRLLHWEALDDGCTGLRMAAVNQPHLALQPDEHAVIAPRVEAGPHHRPGRPAGHICKRGLSRYAPEGLQPANLVAMWLETWRRSARRIRPDWRQPFRLSISSACRARSGKPEWPQPVSGSNDSHCCSITWLINVSATVGVYAESPECGSSPVGGRWRTLRQNTG